MDLLERRCVPCEGGTPPLNAVEADRLGRSVPDWERDGDRIHRSFRLQDFKACVAFLRDIADLAEDEGHHPDLLLHQYRNLTVTLWTHAIHGLSENDYIVAAKIDRLWRNSHA